MTPQALEISMIIGLSKRTRLKEVQESKKVVALKKA
jgi:hypothetical protein